MADDPRHAAGRSPEGLADFLSDPDWAEETVTSGESPLTLVDLSAAASGEVPAAAPAFMSGGSVPWRILVGFAEQAHPDIPAGIFDVLLCRGPAPPPWVSVDDLAAAVSAISQTCERTPMAACVLAQVARLNEHLSVAEATLSESLAYSMLMSGPEFAVRGWGRAD